MITLASGYFGFSSIKAELKARLGSLGEPSMRELFVYGSGSYQNGVTISAAIPNVEDLVRFFILHCKISAEVRTNNNISNLYWLSLHKTVRENPSLGTKIIIMTYSTLNNLLMWS